MKIYNFIMAVFGLCWGARLLLVPSSIHLFEVIVIGCLIFIEGIVYLAEFWRISKEEELRGKINMWNRELKDKIRKH